MSRGFRVHVVGPRERHVEITAWPIHPKSLVRLSRLLRRRRRGYHNPLCIDGHEYHRRQRRRRR